jgi:preprotein translocase subunit Sec63
LPLVICFLTCLIGFLLPYVSMRRWSRRKHQSAAG